MCVFPVKSDSVSQATRLEVATYAQCRSAVTCALVAWFTELYLCSCICQIVGLIVAALFAAGLIAVIVVGVRDPDAFKGKSKVTVYPIHCMKRASTHAMNTQAFGICLTAIHVSAFVGFRMRPLPPRALRLRHCKTALRSRLRVRPYPSLPKQYLPTSRWFSFPHGANGCLDTAPIAKAPIKTTPAAPATTTTPAATTTTPTTPAASTFLDADYGHFALMEQAL